MFTNSGRTRGLLGAAATSIFALGLGAVTGIVPRAGDVTTVRAADAGPVGLAAPAAAQPEVAPEVPPTEVPGPPATEPAEPTADKSPERQRAADRAPSPVAEPEPVAAPDPGPIVEAVAPPPPPASTAVPRRQPSAAEVDQAIAGVRRFVQSVLPINPTHAQVAELGDKVCTAFDEGQTVAQIKATGAELVKKVPFATLLAGGDDYIVRTAVSLYCPGHASKLG